MIDKIEKVLVEKLTNKKEKIGMKLVNDNKYCIVVLSGGQATRFGLNGPKGAYTKDVGYAVKSIFEMLLLDPLKKGINIYIMVSKDNENETKRHFLENKELSKYLKQVNFFRQEERNLRNIDGTKLKIDGKEITASAGHGSVFKSLKTTGMLEKMKADGVSKVMISNVDNICGGILDYSFIGESLGTDLVIKTVKRENPNEKVGLFALKDKKLEVIEYTEVDANLRNKKDNEGFFLNWCNVMLQIMDIKYIERISDAKMKIHKQFKKKWNKDFIKEEKFLFDIFPKAKVFKIFEVDRTLEFSPIKTIEDVDKAVLQYIIKKIKKKNLESEIRELLD